MAEQAKLSGPDFGSGIDPTSLALAGRFLSDAFSGRAPRTGPIPAQGR